MFQKRKLTVGLIGLFILLAGSLLHLSCIAPYYYDRQGHRYWRDGHDDDWHKSRGDQWDEWRPGVNDHEDQGDHHDHDDHGDH